MSQFVAGLRTPPQALRVPAADGTAPWTMRVQCAEAWDAVRIELSPNTSVRDAKHAAMRVLMSDVSEEGEYVVKLRGWEVLDETQSVASAGAQDGSTLLVMARRRRPVR